MATTRRGFIASTVATTSAVVTPPAHAVEDGHDHYTLPSDLALRVKSLESLLVEKGMVDPAALDAVVDAFEHNIGPRNGARVIARAWSDAGYKNNAS
jgi:nitrile hydratase subunit alpha